MSTISRLRLVLALVPAIALAPAAGFAQALRPAQVTVVTDINFPPYLFPGEDGRPQGILKDKWDLWSRTTGVTVKLEGMEWRKAQDTVQQGGADVIEALAYTDARAKLYEFSPPYAPMEAKVFFHKSVTGVNDVASLRGFTIGAKDGSACSNWLAERNIDGIRKYPTSQDVIAAAVSGEVRLFCMDVPPAQYFLIKRQVEEDFRQTPPLYSTQFHWAVRKGRTELRDFIQAGFAAIPKAKLEEIDARWLGNPVRSPVDPRTWYYGMFAVGALLLGALFMGAWNWALRRRVSAGTAELRSALQAVEQKAMEVRDLYNNAPCGYHSCDAQGRFLEINATELAWLGRNTQEVLGVPFRDFLMPASRVAYDAAYPEFKKTGIAHDLEFELKRSDGSTMQVLLSATAVRAPDGAYIRSRTTLYDVTARRKAEQAVRDLNADLERKVGERTAELASANRELESFSYSVSHDLRAPLRAIEGYTKLAVELGAGDSNATVKGYLDRVEGASRRMAQLVDSLLELARISRGKLQRVPVDLTRLATDIAADIQSDGAWQGSEVRVDPGMQVQADPGLLRIVMDNLMRNAFKFSSKVPTPAIHVGSETRDGTPAYFVRDNGVGFDMAYSDKLFTPFQRLHSVEEFSGTGIGLAIVQRIVGRHGGKVWAQSRPGEGASFYFTLGDAQASPNLP